MTTSQSGTAGTFTTGSIMRHVLVMTATGSIGLIAIFIVDALNLFYISLLGQEELAAAIGFAGTLQFFVMSISIGFTIATSALVARALGRGERATAAELGGASLLFMVLTSLAVIVVVWPFLDQLVGLLGARGNTRALAVHFLQIVIPSSVVMSVGMGASGILRGVGDAKRAMYVTLVGGLAAAILDPLFIFGFDLGITGAAIANVLSRFVLAGVGLWGVIRIHRLIRMPDLKRAKMAMRPFLAIGLPAVLTQLATPVGNAYVTIEIAAFGDQAVAGWAIIGRLVPVAFGAIFALSGAVGPIIGQNYGAKLYPRVTAVLRDSLVLTLIYVLVVWALLALSRNGIADLFGATDEARALINFFCLFAAASFLFNGGLFVANAAFNNLGYATYSTLFNWGRSTLGVIPFVWLGAHWYGAVGVIAGWGLGAVIFGVASVIVCFRVLKQIEDRSDGDDRDRLPAPPPSAHSPFSTGKAATLG
jgi:putative MATE family efflux protein